MESAAESEGAAARTSEGADEREEEGATAALCSDAFEKTGRDGRDIVTTLCCVTNEEKWGSIKKEGEKEEKCTVCVWFVSALCLVYVYFVFILRFFVFALCFFFVFFCYRHISEDIACIALIRRKALAIIHVYENSVVVGGIMRYILRKGRRKRQRTTA